MPFSHYMCLLQFFLLFQLFIINKVKQKIMAYHSFTPVWNYNFLPSFTFFPQNYAFSPFDSFQVLNNYIQPEYNMNIQFNQKGSQIKTQIKNLDTKSNDIYKSDGKIECEQKKINFKKPKRKARNVQKELQSAKKNCESNLVNHFLSYFSSFNNISQLVTRTLRKMDFPTQFIKENHLQVIALFSKQISIVNSRKERKYVNKAFLQNYFFQQKLQKYMPDILENIDRSELITRAQFCELFRRCCFHFFRTISISSVTSSAKLNPISRPEHIKRRRIVVQSCCKK